MATDACGVAAQMPGEQRHSPTRVWCWWTFTPNFGFNMLGRQLYPQS